LQDPLFDLHFLFSFFPPAWLQPEDAAEFEECGAMNIFFLVQKVSRRLGAAAGAWG
jgi:hypothetical protein